MDATTLKMAMAGLFHDIGKFADKDTMGITEKYFNDNASIYLPSRNGNFSHYHALYTAAFIEQMRKMLPPELNSADWGEGDAFINLAACHHKPETPMQQIITEADWLTSGLDRDEFKGKDAKDIAFQDYKKTRLLPLFEQLMEHERDAEEKFDWCYPLAPLSSNAFFPTRKKKMEKREAEADYRRLYDGFTEELRNLRHMGENILLWFEHFESLMMEYLSSVPAARAGKVVHDVSLYDHSRLTAAFATAMFAYHKENESLNIWAIKETREQKFVLVSGNFFGIQKFIFSGYGDTRKYRSKILRGRSFYVSLLSELAADVLCRELGLPFTSVILNAAGRFTVLAANTDRTAQTISDVKGRINEWLVGIGFGEISIGISTTKAAHEDFSPGRFLHLWDRVGEELEKGKSAKLDLDRHGGVIPGYLERFHSGSGRPICPLCEKRPASPHTLHFLPSEDIGPVCSICRDHIFLGSRLVKRDQIVVAHGNTEGLNESECLMEPLFGRYQVVFPEHPDRLVVEPQDLLKYWDISLPSDANSSRGVAKKILNSYVPVYTEEDLNDERILSTEKSETTQQAMIDEMELGEPMTLGHIATKALNIAKGGRHTGIDALGVMKADMDHLGMLMACGLEDNRHTISRMATLSRQVNQFFCLYLPRLLRTDRRFRCVYTVFAGGDDLFLIGPWNRIYELSLVLSTAFTDYVCSNSNVTVSAGISLQKPHTPLSTLSESAEQALEQSKAEGRHRLTMFSESVTWTELAALDAVREKVELWLEEGWVTKSMLYRLNGFIEMAEMEKVLIERSEILKEDLKFLKWRALLSYSCARNIAKSEKKERRERIIEELLPLMTEWLETYGGRLRIPLWNVLYNHR